MNSIRRNNRRADTFVDAQFERLRGNTWVDRAFYAASEAGNHSFIWHFATVLEALIARDVRIFRITTVLGLESAFVNGFVKTLFGRKRPVQNDDRPHHLRSPKTSSFPSGHATSAFCAAAVLAQVAPRRRGLYYALATVISASRVHVRIHHSSDVVAGVALGAVLGEIAKRTLFRHWSNR